MTWDLSKLIDNELQQLIHVKLADKTIQTPKESELWVKQLIKKFSEVN